MDFRRPWRPIGRGSVYLRLVRWIKPYVMRRALLILSPLPWRERARERGWGMPSMPLRRLLVSMGNPQRHVFTVRLRINHQAYREAAGSEAAGHGDAAQVKDVSDAGVAVKSHVVVEIGFGARIDRRERPGRHHRGGDNQGVDFTQGAPDPLPQFCIAPQQDEVVGGG